MTQPSSPHDWRGIFPSLCTPFTPDGEIDVEAQRRIVRFALDCGAHGLVCFGLAGEVGRLAPDEREELARVILDEVGGRVPVLIGAGAESARTTRRLARQAEACGASAVVVAAPAGVHLDGADLARYFADAASAVELPVMVQEAGAYLGVSLSPGIVREAAERAPNIRLVKIEAGPVEMRRWIEALGAGFRVWGGDGGMYQRECLRLGAAGIVPGVEVVDLLVSVYEADEAGDERLAAERFASLLPLLLFEMQSIECYVACGKRILAWRGVLEHITAREPAASFPGELEALLSRLAGAVDLPVHG